MMDDSTDVSEDTMMKDDMTDDVMEDKKEMMNDSAEVAEEVMIKKDYTGRERFLKCYKRKNYG